MSFDDWDARQARERRALRRALDDGARAFARAALKAGHARKAVPGDPRGGWEVVLVPSDYHDTKIAVLEDGSWQNIGSVLRRRSWIVDVFDGKKFTTGLAGTEPLPPVTAERAAKLLASALVELERRR